MKNVFVLPLIIIVVNGGYLPKERLQRMIADIEVAATKK